MKDDNMDEFESCSVCLVEVRWTSLRDHGAGNICRDCYAELS